MAQPHIIKIVILGSSGVGKSSIVSQYVSNYFDNDVQATLGISFYEKVVKYKGNSYKFQIWDTAGQERYGPLAQMYYRDANFAILVYDSTNKQSFTGLKHWQVELQSKGPKDIKLAIVGNKSELTDEEEVSVWEGQKYALKNKAIFKATSAKENKGICELFDSIIEEVLESPMDLTSDGRISRLSKDPKVEDKNKNKCCS